VDMESPPLHDPASKLRRLTNRGLILFCGLLLGVVVCVIVARGRNGDRETTLTPTVPTGPVTYVNLARKPIFIPTGSGNILVETVSAVLSNHFWRKDAYVPRPPTLDDAGGQIVWLSYFVPFVNDPLSLEAVRDCYLSAPSRGIAEIQKELEQGDLRPEDRLWDQVKLAQIYMFQGDTIKALEELTRVRAEVESD